MYCIYLNGIDIFLISPEVVFYILQLKLLINVINILKM